MRYKVGDRVVIRKNLVSGWYYHYENSMGRLFFNSHMYKLCGKICVVTKITDLVLKEIVGALRNMILKRKEGQLC